MVPPASRSEELPCPPLCPLRTLSSLWSLGALLTLERLPRRNHRARVRGADPPLADMLSMEVTARSLAPPTRRSSLLSLATDGTNREDATESESDMNARLPMDPLMSRTSSPA